jgi:hypothetical protein
MSKTKSILKTHSGVTLIEEVLLGSARAADIIYRVLTPGGGQWAGPGREDAERCFDEAVKRHSPRI